MKTEVKDTLCAVCNKTSSQTYVYNSKPDASANLDNKVKFLDQVSSSVQLQKCPHCSYINVDIAQKIVPNIAEIVLHHTYASSVEEDLDPDTFYYYYLEKQNAITNEVYGLLAENAELNRQSAISYLSAAEKLESAVKEFISDLDGAKQDDTDKAFIDALKYRIKKNIEKASLLITKHIEEYPEDYIAKCALIRILQKNKIKNKSLISRLKDAIINDEYMPEEVKALVKKITK